ncbi:MAG TPA: hypothetical protein VMU00_01205 [Steroidobacteraceae bacterium]|nr:hypothetical protein [Steroidobacteraceae bacterium]
MKHPARPEPEAAVTPESAVWLLYAGLVHGLRWRRHVLAAGARPYPPASPRRRGLAPR